MFALGKRIFLFMLVNLLVVVTISVVLAVLGVGPYLSQQGLDLGSLAIFCLVWGMGGAMISLALSKVMAKWMMKVQIVPENTSNTQLREIYQMVRELSTAASIPMPEVGVYDSPEINAFATGPTKRSSLVAVSTGLLRNMNKPEVRGVLAHEVAHIANGDMVTMTLLQGVVNAFVMFLARVLAYAVANLARGRDEDSPISMGVFFISQIVFEILFMILGSIVVASFSRWREYRADSGGARLAGRDQMVAALEALKRNMSLPAPREEVAAFRSMQIDPGKNRSWAQMFSTHPPLEERIQRLKMWQA